MAMPDAIVLAVLWLCLQTGPGSPSAPGIMMTKEVIPAMLGFLISKKLVLLILRTMKTNKVSIYILSNFKGCPIPMSKEIN